MSAALGTGESSTICESIRTKLQMLSKIPTLQV